MHPLRRLATMAGCSCLLTTLCFSPAPARSATASVTLGWAAPGEAGMAARALAYALRYSTAPITSANFSTAAMVTGLPAPLPPGSFESFTVGGLAPSTSYYFALKTIDDAGNWSSLSNVLFVPAWMVGSDDRPGTLEFSAAWPNPARLSVRCAYALPKPAGFRVDVLDLTGRHVRTLASEDRLAGRGEVEWDLRDGAGRRVAAGLYFVHAHLAGRTWTRRVTVVP